MKTQTIERSTQSTCSTCPYFQDFGERNERGWCHLFDQMARKPHNRTGDCEQEIETVELVQQELEPEPQLQPAGLAGDSVACQLLEPIGSGATRSPEEKPQQLAPEPEPEQTAETEFKQGHIHGRNDALAGWHPIYPEPLTEYATGYLAGYSIVMNPVVEHSEVSKPLEWSVYLDARWGLYQAWVGDRCIGQALRLRKQSA